MTLLLLVSQWLVSRHSTLNGTPEQPRQGITITMPDGTERNGNSWETSPLDIAKDLSKSLADRVVIAKVCWIWFTVHLTADNSQVDGELWDLERPLEKSVKLELLDFENLEGQLEQTWLSYVLSSCHQEKEFSGTPPPTFLGRLLKGIMVVTSALVPQPTMVFFMRWLPIDLSPFPITLPWKKSRKRRSRRSRSSSALLSQKKTFSECSTWVWRYFGYTLPTYSLSPVQQIQAVPHPNQSPWWYLYYSLSVWPHDRSMHWTSYTPHRKDQGIHGH